jgi:predicted Fe-Mo cluster-binding NifX family protein
MMMKTAALLALGLLLFSAAEGPPEQRTLKIAVASDGKTTESPISGKAARCKYFLLFDEEGQLTEILENPHGNAPGGAGPKTADFLAQKEVTLLVAGNIGSKMKAALKRQEIVYVEFSGTVEEGLLQTMKDL